MKKNQYGFAALEVAVIIVVLAVLGAVGWYVYQKNKADDKKTNTSQNSDSEDTKNPDNNDDVAQSYITLSEWGVRAPYDGSQKLTPSLKAGELAIINFSSEQLAALDPACSTDAAAGGNIQRFKPTDPAYPDGSTEPTAEEAAKTDSKFKKVGNYYYLFRHSQSGCGDTAKTETLQHEVNDLVEALVPKLETTP